MAAIELCGEQLCFGSAQFLAEHQGFSPCGFCHCHITYFGLDGAQAREGFGKVERRVQLPPEVFRLA